MEERQGMMRERPGEARADKRRMYQEEDVESEDDSGVIDDVEDEEQE